MKKYSLSIFFLLTASYWLSALPAHAADTNVALFPDLAKADPVSYIVGGFNYVAGFIAALVVLVALWGVIKLMSHPGSSTDKSESRGIFWNLLLGVLFFALIYFFFTTILSPDLGTLRLPSLQSLKDAPVVTGVGSPGSIDNSAAAQTLRTAGVGIKDGVSLQGLQQGTLDEIVSLKNQCGGGCDVVVTSGTEASCPLGGASTASDPCHTAGTTGFSHANGYKADFRDTSTLTNFITSNFTQLPQPRTSDGAIMYRDPATGAIYAHETFPNPANNHWDMVSQPPKT